MPSPRRRKTAAGRGKKKRSGGLAGAAQFREGGAGGDGRIGRLRQVGAQHVCGVAGALAAAGGHAQLAAQLVHGAEPQVDGLADFAVGDVVADTNDQGASLQKVANRTLVRLVIIRIILISMSILTQVVANCKRFVQAGKRCRLRLAKAQITPILLLSDTTLNGNYSHYGL